MKNIHILLTHKPSKLFKDDFGYYRSFEYLKRENFLNQHIYITSDEEIKEGDWMIRGNEQPTLVTPNFFWDFGVRYYKIILTTDGELIKDGVQAIDDDFLEWFVKNPSCEEFEVKKVKGRYRDFGGNVHNYINYRIIIPKEEPKQRLERYSERFDNNESAIGNPETWGRRIKQETLEEVAERILANNIDGLRDALKDDDLFFFYKGVVQCYGEAMAKWQKEKTIEEVFDWLTTNDYLTDLKETLIENFKNR